jgi:hypothetical protein
MPGKNKVKRLERRRDRAQGKLDAINTEKTIEEPISRFVNKAKQISLAKELNNVASETAAIKNYPNGLGRLVLKNLDTTQQSSNNPKVSLQQATKDVRSKGTESIARMNQQAKDDLKYMPVDERAATMKKGPIYKTEAREARDYAANAVYDTKHGKKSEAKFEKKKLMHIVNSIAGSRSRG